jgi:muramoyltetrapeptide carboxypeptidase LdcA involved in peptidoglycan recycling
VILQEGEAAGRIVGGNLCSFNLLQGTPFMPALSGSVIFAEDAQIVASKPELSGMPVIGNVDFGHATPIVTFPIGGTLEVRAERAAPRLTITSH